MDLMVERTAQRVEETGVYVQKQVLDPVREVSAIVVGIKVALVEPGFYATAITDKSLQVKPDVEDSPYAEAERKTIDFYVNGVAQGGDPRYVAEKIVELARAHQPPLRTVCGPDAQMLAEGYKTMPPEEFAAIGKSLIGL